MHGCSRSPHYHSHFAHTDRSQLAVFTLYSEYSFLYSLLFTAGSRQTTREERATPRDDPRAQAFPTRMMSFVVDIVERLLLTTAPRSTVVRSIADSRSRAEVIGR